MKDFVAMVFEFNTGGAELRGGLLSRLATRMSEFNAREAESSATLWLHVGGDELLRTHIPADMEDLFTPIGPLPLEAAERASAFLKEMLAHFEVDYVEHTTSDD